MLIIAHRGAPNLCVENTMQSFATALDYGVDGIELDAQYSKDKQIVVFHDWDLSRFTGKNTLIADVDYIYLKTINLNKSAEFIGIPLFEDVAAIMPQDKYFHIEIKSKKHIGNKGFVRHLIQIIKKYNLQDKTIISSFNPFVLWCVKQIDPTIKRGVLWTGKKKKSWYIRKFNLFFISPYSFHIDIKYLTEDFIFYLKNKNIQIYLYTIKNKKQYSIAKRYNVDGIFSNIPNLSDQ